MYLFHVFKKVDINGKPMLQCSRVQGGNAHWRLLPVVSGGGVGGEGVAEPEEGGGIARAWIVVDPKV